MKKILVMLLALVFCFGLVGQALADDNQGGWQNAFGQEKQEKFKELKGHWAEEAMMEMNARGIFRGYQDGTFRPSNVVSNLEAIVMIVRAADLDTDNDGEDIDELKHGKKIPAWAAGYVQAAIDEDILLEEEFAGFQPNQAAKRMEVARWICRAFDIDEDDDEAIEEFLDDHDIPDQFFGAVSAMARHKIMIGDDKHFFWPNKAVTRAEMMVILSRIDENFQWAAQRYVQGYLDADVEDGDDEIVVDSNKWADPKTFELADELTVYVDGDKTDDLADLEEGMHVRLVLDNDGKVIFIRANTVDADEDENDEDDEDDEDEEMEYAGIVEDIDDEIFNIDLNDDVDDVTINVDEDSDADADYYVDEDTEFKFDLGIHDADIDDVDEGDEVEFETEGDLITKIEFSREVEEGDLEGVVDGIAGDIFTIDVDDDDDPVTINVNDDQDKEADFYVNDDTEFAFDLYGADVIGNVDEDDLVEFEFAGDLIKKIKFTSPEVDD